MDGPAADLAEAGLRYVSEETPGWSRRRAGKGFAYNGASGPLKDPRTVAWIRSLAIPPAWTEVWISPHRNGHILATGRDARGRKQYRYHPRWREVRDCAKFERMLAFGMALPRIRKAVDGYLGRPGLSRERVLALVVRLLETTLIRVGNSEYARENRTFGLTTLRRRHLSIEGGKLRFAFKGKGGKTHNVTVRSRRLARLVGRLQELPGQELFCFVDEEGRTQAVDSADVNAFLRDIAGGDFTAKDFRTFAATVLAAWALQELSAFDSEAAAKRNVTAAIERVAGRLGHTPAICRKSYVHPEIVGAYMAGDLLLNLKDAVEAQLAEDLAGLEPEEAAVLAFLQQRLKQAAERSSPAAV